MRFLPGREDKFVCPDGSCAYGNEETENRGKTGRPGRIRMRSMPAGIVPCRSSRRREEEWLINFKNETHNHPTEIEPFGGAATCLGGAIRDPLSGRTYVYQAMRVTGAADPTVSVKETLKGKLPQKKLVRGSARIQFLRKPDRSGDRICKEIYHPDYVAKRMEIGAVLGRSPRRAVIREIPIREILSFCWADVPVVTVAAVLPVLPRYIQKSPSRPAAQRFRKETHRQSVRSSVCSAGKR